MGERFGPVGGEREATTSAASAMRNVLSDGRYAGCDLLFSVIKFDWMLLNLAVRIALMPLVAGLSYEIIRYAAKKESGAIFKLMTLPGIWLQNITTQEPDGEQLEVAIKALDESLNLNPGLP